MIDDLVLFILLMEESRLTSRDQKLATLNHIITFQNNHHHSKMLAQRSKRQIEGWLSTEANILINKQEKNHQKQDKLKELQDKYQLERAKKQKEIEQKLIVSEKNKNKNLQNIQKKMNEVAKRHQSVYSKAQSQKMNQLQKQFDSRKVYANQAQKTESRMSRASSHSKTYLPKGERSFENEQSVDRKIFQINSRLEKAHSVTKQRQQKIIHKIRQHNTSQIQAAQEKASRQIAKQITDFSHKIASKLEGADSNKQKYDKSMEKKQEDKHKAFEEKLRGYQTNIRNLQNEESYKLEQLSKKFDKNLNANKSWKDEKGEVYHKKFLANYSLLQQKKMSRADQIIQKHLQLTNKNKVYKQRKQTLFQAIKCDPTSA